LESAPDQGTTVRLCLPRFDIGKVEMQAVSSPAPEEERVGETALLVDDEDGVREPASEHLRELGYAVLEARDGPARCGHCLPSAGWICR
jgi:hypothetical protein